MIRGRDLSKQDQSRLSVLLTIMASGMLLVLVFNQPRVTTAAQRDFVAGAPEMLDTSDIRALRIRWEAGARSNWHSHAGWQILAAEEGRGRTQVGGGPMEEMVPGGRPIYTGPGVVHWHGADPDEYVVQLTFMGGMAGPEGETRYEAVSEADYLGR